MIRNKLILGILAILIFNSSCSPLKPIPQPLPSPSTKWTVKMNQSGGFAPVLLSVEVSSDGHLKAEDQISHRTVSQTISVQKTTEIMQLISKTSVPSKNMPESGCADCFIYDLEIQSEGSDIHLQVDDVTIKDSGAADMIALLRTLRDETFRSAP